MKGLEFVLLGSVYLIIILIVEYFTKLELDKRWIFIGMIIWGIIQWSFLDK